MVRVIVQQAPGPVELFRHHDSDQGMGQGQVGQGPAPFGPLQAGLGETFRTPHQQSQIPPARQPLGQSGGKLFGAPGTALHIQRDHSALLRDRLQHPFSFFLQDARDVRPLAAPPRGDLYQLQRTFRRQASGIFRIAFDNPARHPVSNRDQMDIHGGTFYAKPSERVIAFVIHAQNLRHLQHLLLDRTNFEYPVC